MSLITLGFGILACMLAWRCVWKPTALSSARDALFDLRDLRVRAWFVERNLPLDHKAYKALRELLNGHLRHLERVGIWAQFHFLIWCAKNQDIVNERAKQIDKLFETDNPELAKLSKEVREDAFMIVIAYIFETSPILLLLSLIVGLYVICAVTINVLKDLVVRPYSDICLTRRGVASVLIALVALVPGLSRSLPQQSAFEDNALYQSV